MGYNEGKPYAPARGAAGGQTGIQGEKKGQTMDIMERTEALFEKEAWLIDIFPKTVPYREDGRYFKAERLLQKDRAEIQRRFTRLILKLYCYHDLTVTGSGLSFALPEPEMLESLLKRFFGAGAASGDLILYLPEQDAMIVPDREDLHMTVYAPDEALKELLAALAGAEGLFFYKAP